MSLNRNNLLAYQREISQILDRRPVIDAPPPPFGHALLPCAPRCETDGSRTLACTLDLHTAHYLADHRIDGRAVLPMAVALEMMAQFVTAGWPGWQVVAMQGLQVLSGIALEADAPQELLLRAAVRQQDASSVLVEIMDARRSVVRYRAVAMLAKQLPLVSPLPRFDALSGGVSMDATQAYGEWLFHGERFRGLQRIDCLLTAGVDAVVRPSVPQALVGEAGVGRHWLFDPVLLDLPPQLAWIWSRMHRGMIALPSRVGRVTRFGDTVPVGPLSLGLRIRAVDEASLGYDAQIVDSQGAIRLLIEDGQSIMSAALNRLAPDHPQFRRGPSDMPPEVQRTSA